MANPTWFIKEDYLLSKLAQLQKLDPAAYGSWNIVTVDEALKAAGYTNAYDHFAQFGALERTSPNKYFDANEYLAAKAAQLNAAKHGGRSDWTAESVALAINDAGLTPYAHFDQVGWQEGVNPSNKFDVNAYLDSKAAQLNKDKVDGKTDWTAADVKKAFVDAGFDPISHYQAAGQQEKIAVTPAKTPVTPEDVKGDVFTLTTAAGEKIVGTAGNDEVRGVAGNATAGNNTLNIGDTIDGGAGKDTLNLTFDTGNASVPAGVEIKNIEVVNLNVTSAAAEAGFLSSSLYSGVQQLWQVDTGAQGAAVTGVASASGVAANGGTANATVALTVADSQFGAVTVAEGVTAGFKGNGKADAQGVYANGNLTVSQAVTNNATATADMTVNVTADAPAVVVNAASNTQKVISIALDGVGSGSKLDVVGRDVETVNVSGSLIKNATLNVDLDSKVKTVNASLTTDTALTLGTQATVETLNLSGSTGGITLSVENGYNALKSLAAGSGADRITLNDAVAQDLTVNLGAGNDVVTIAGNNATAAAATGGGTREATITLGEGKDTVKLDGAFVSNISNVDEIATNGLTSVTDFKVGEDALTFSATPYQGLTEGQLSTIAGSASLKAAADAAIKAAGSGKVTVFGYDGDTYVVADSNNSGGFSNGDGLIELTGVDAAALIASTTSFVLIA